MMTVETASIFIALYGALLSTAVALVQLVQFNNSKKFLLGSISRSFGNKCEYIKLRIVNGSNSGVEIHQVHACNFGIGGEAGFHELVGQSIPLYKDDGRISDDEYEHSKLSEQKLPHRLEPGDSLCAFFSSTDAISMIKMDLPTSRGQVHSNLFSFSIDHSRSTDSRNFYFELEKQYLGLSFSSWRKISSLQQRLRIRKISRIQQ